ncbi:hypothetical protein AAFF_G00136810 [Aldrovandia affinis]|uniref:Uncharacterized protein n=1 Tax=Aldrovandia affinis TaxID=143900 RepID=A0AAD7X2F1_9TELE|nr:hypothetical protein AAFF_G00136810 [Aldrovandia affinis]
MDKMYRSLQAQMLSVSLPPRPCSSAEAETLPLMFPSVHKPPRRSCFGPLAAPPSPLEPVIHLTLASGPQPKSNDSALLKRSSGSRCAELKSVATSRGGQRSRKADTGPRHAGIVLITEWRDSSSPLLHLRRKGDGRGHYRRNQNGAVQRHRGGTSNVTGRVTGRGRGARLRRHPSC